MSRIPLKFIPGAIENRVRWLFASGVSTEREATILATRFFRAVEKIKASLQE